jgi:hypothetical protein
VRQYEGKGDSPFGVVDMAGNVWEWCLTDYGNRTDDLHSVARFRALRGGSWLDRSLTRRFPPVAPASWYDPVIRPLTWGVSSHPLFKCSDILISGFLYSGTVSEADTVPREAGSLWYNHEGDLRSN